MKTYKEFIQNIFEYDDRTDQYVADEIKRRKLAKIVVNATDDRKMIRGKADFTMDHHTGSSKIHVYLKKMSPSVSKYNYDLRFESVEEAHSAAQQAAIANEENIEEKNVPTNPSLWSRAKSLAKSKFDVYPSAYANGWAAKWYKSKGGGWKKA